MDVTRVVAVALLLCVAPIGGVIAVDTADGPQQTDEEIDRSMSVVTVANTSEYLAPGSDAIEQSEERTTGIDVSGAVEADAGQLRSDYVGESLQRQFRDADTIDERRVVIERGGERLSERAEELEQKERSTIQEFNDGTASSQELLRTLGTVHREAETTIRTLEWLETTAEDINADDVAEDAAAARLRLLPVTGPVRGQLSRAIEGESTSRIHVETAGNGVILATIDPAGERYLREAHDPTAKQPDVSDRYDGNPSPALDRFNELYPWAIAGFDAIDAIGPASVRLYRLGASHQHGELETYLDSGSTNILYETQRNDLDAIPTETRQRTEGDLEIRLNTTRAGGPLAVTVVDTTTDERVDATVELNDDPIGSTDGDRLWTVAPRGTTTVSVSHGGETVTFDVLFS